jgi:tRNA(fMet)-specific endonuclease VapC
MMLRFMLDTDTVSYALRGLRDVPARLLEHRPSELCMSAITLGELHYGAECRRSRRLHSLIETFAATVPAVPFDQAAARHFGRLAAGLAQQGKPIGPLDTLIAAHALALNVTLVTNNLRHFTQVRGLRIENWFAS